MPTDCEISGRELSTCTVVEGDYPGNSLSPLLTSACTTINTPSAINVYMWLIYSSSCDALNCLLYYKNIIVNVESGR